MPAGRSGSTLHSSIEDISKFSRTFRVNILHRNFKKKTVASVSGFVRVGKKMKRNFFVKNLVKSLCICPGI